jgi:hypothetical protein
MGPIPCAWYNEAQPPPPGPDCGAVKTSARPTKTERRTVFTEMASAIYKAKREFRGNARYGVVKVSKNDNIYMNSVAILTGAQSGGKTFTASAESQIICRNWRNTHMLIFIKKKAFDPTVEYIEPLMQATGCKFVEIGYEEADNFFNTIFSYKYLYNNVK